MQQPGDRGMLMSRDLPGSSSPQCVRFVYVFYKPAAVCLHFFILASGTTCTNLSWTTQGPTWASWPCGSEHLTGNPVLPNVKSVFLVLKNCHFFEKVPKLAIMWAPKLAHFERNWYTKI